jgi:hypothetical protein
MLHRIVAVNPYMMSQHVPFMMSNHVFTPNPTESPAQLDKHTTLTTPHPCPPPFLMPARYNTMPTQSLAFPRPPLPSPQPLTPSS